MFHLVLVAVGGAIGAALRHLVNMGSLRLVGPGYPWGTMVINIDRSESGEMTYGATDSATGVQISLFGFQRASHARGALDDFADVTSAGELREAMGGLNLPARERFHPDGDLFAAA